MRQKPSRSSSHVTTAKPESTSPNGVLNDVAWQDREVESFTSAGQRYNAQRLAKKGLIVNGVKGGGDTTQIDQSQTVVVGHGDEDPEVNRPRHKELVVLSSDETDESASSCLSEDDDDATANANLQPPKDHLVADAEDGTSSQDDPTGPPEPSFGDLVQANTTEAIDVEAAFDDGLGPPQALYRLSGPNPLRAPSATSLGTVLTQSLRTNDVSLLESCLHITDLASIRSTIERLDSNLAATLLSKLAERLHRRPGRAGSLMVWIQWTLVSHGGYLASQPELVGKLTALHRVVKERARGLQPLLSLKGKLDMLEAQMQLRKGMQQSSFSGDFGEDEEDDERVIYVEGQEEDEGAEDEAEMGPTRSYITPKSRRNPTKGEDHTGHIGGASESDEEDDMPTTVNGVAPDSGEDDQDSDSDDPVDGEAEETDDDSGEGLDDDDDDDVDVDDMDSAEGEDSEDDLPPAKRPALSRPGGASSSQRP